MAHSAGISPYPPFWIYVFSVAALVGLTLVQPKLVDRQRSIEGAATKRVAVATGDPASAVRAESAGQVIPFWPIHAALAVSAVACGALTLRRHLRSIRKSADGEGAATDAAATPSDPLEADLRSARRR